MRGVLSSGVLLASLLVCGGAAHAQSTMPNYGRATASAVKAQPDGPQERALDKVRWEQNLNTQLPLDATFRDEAGQQVQLKQYFNGKRPVVLGMIFYNCTMLCSEVLNGMMRSLKEVDYKPGKEYDVVIISINPKETPEIAAGKKKSYLDEYGFKGTESGWHFLTGTEENIKKVTNAAGYFYTYEKSTDQYAHPGGMVMLTPQGKIARYHTGVLFEPRDVRLSLLEAGESKIGSPVDLILLRCFHYDPTSGTYTVAILQVLRFAAGLFVILIGGGLALWVRRDMKKEKSDGALVAGQR